MVVPKVLWWSVSVSEFSVHYNKTLIGLVKNGLPCFRLNWLFSPQEWVPKFGKYQLVQAGTELLAIPWADLSHYGCNKGAMIVSGCCQSSPIPILSILPSLGEYGRPCSCLNLPFFPQTEWVNQILACTVMLLAISWAVVATLIVPNVLWWSYRVSRVVPYLYQASTKSG